MSYGTALSKLVAECQTPEDCTEDLQRALSTCASLVAVPVLAGGHSWVVRPLHVTCDNQVVDFAAGVVLQAKRGEFHKGPGGHELFTVKNRTNITIRGGRGTTFRMWRSDYGNASLYNHSEARHGISLYGATNVRLDGLTVTETGGDGVYISNVLGEIGTPNHNITIANCDLISNYRNAISVISVDGLLIVNTTLAKSKGTPPQGGIDFEPNSAQNLLKNILLENVTIFNNTQRSITLSGHALKSNLIYAPISISIKNTRIFSGGSFGISINTSPFGVPLGSTLSLDQVVVSNTAGSGLLLEDKHVNLKTTVSNTVFNNVAGMGENPIWIEGRNAPCVGAVFQNVTVYDKKPRDAVNFMADVEHMEGEIMVDNPQCAKEVSPPNNDLQITCK